MIIRTSDIVIKLQPLNRKCPACLHAAPTNRQFRGWLNAKRHIPAAHMTVEDRRRQKDARILIRLAMLPGALLSAQNEACPGRWLAQHSDATLQ
mgnify:CR=1 FL=1